MEKIKLQMKRWGMTGRWSKSVLTVLIVVFALYFLLAAYLVRSNYYTNVEKTITGFSASAAANHFNLYNQEGEFVSAAGDFIEQYTEWNQAEVWIIDGGGDILMSSSGFPVQPEEMPDYQAAMEANDTGTWIGRIASGEKVFASTIIITGESGNQIGAVRFITSLEAVDRQIRMINLLFLATVAALLGTVIFVSLRFLRSISTPVREIGDTAVKIAQGDFDARIEKKYDDEIGTLADTINDMAGEIAATDKLKNDFISTVSHELRTPLTSIKGWGETLILDPMTDPELTHRGLQVMISESARLSEIVEELLDFSRMQNGQMVLRLDKIDILAELDEILFVFKERALREGIEIQYNTPDLPAPAFADANRIKQVFVNILDNAIKYTEEGGRIFVSAEIQEHAIQIIVADNGCGIAAQDLPRVKEKFYKSNISVKGSGIGLAVADEIISLHGGTLDIASVEHEETTVYIKLPLDTLPPADKERSPNKDE